jgi:uncharacterized protein RhaS with RHS repeats
MKRTWRRLILGLLLLLAAWPHRASAYYDPGVQRWVNRDPIADAGFQVTRSRAPRAPGGKPNPHGFVGNTPVNNLDSLGLEVWGGKGVPPPAPLNDPCPCGEPAAQIRAVGPLDAATANRLAQEALAAARASGLPGLRNGQADAFRHCFWSCRMAQELGSDQAKEVADTHERCGRNPKDEEAMDQANNAVGRGFGTPGADCNHAGIEAVRHGPLQTSPGGTPPSNPYSGGS